MKKSNSSWEECYFCKNKIHQWDNCPILEDPNTGEFAVICFNCSKEKFDYSKEDDDLENEEE